MCKVVLCDLSEPARSVRQGPDDYVAGWMIVGSQFSNLFVLITFRLHWWAAEIPGLWGRQSTVVSEPWQYWCHCEL